MKFIDELGYERAKYLFIHPNDKDQKDDLILRKYGIYDIHILNRFIMEYEKMKYKFKSPPIFFIRCN